MADQFAKLDKIGIKKKIIYAGKTQEQDYDDGTKVCPLFIFRWQSFTLFS